MTERERLAPGHITAMKPDDSERDYRECVVRMEETERRLQQSPSGERFPGPSEGFGRAVVTTPKRSSGKGCWYFISVASCPLCGYEDEIRERRDTPRPERWEDRHDFYDYACGEHFA